MPDFDPAWKITRLNEGDLSDDPADAGGITKGGISLRFLKTLGDSDLDGYLDGDTNHDGLVDRADVLGLTDPHIRQIAYREFWVKMRCSELTSQDVASKVFDFALNMGPGAAALILQRACRAVQRSVLEDGLIGPRTLAAANSADGEALAVAMRCEGAAIYRMIVSRRPDQQVFLRGWLNRAYA
jgi:lysozyme family protein